jgi:hypothetical protein
MLHVFVSGIDCASVFTIFRLLEFAIVLNVTDCFAFPLSF